MYYYEARQSGNYWTGRVYTYDDREDELVVYESPLYDWYCDALENAREWAREHGIEAQPDPTW